jgi:class 3 adenylate cyclase
MERHLAASLAADVVGYSALMERDEAGTFARLEASAPGRRTWAFAGMTSNI